MLADAGLLDGRTATTHWMYAERLRSRAPLATIDERVRYVEDRGATNGVVGRTPVSLDRNAHTNAVFAGDSVWVSSDTTELTRTPAAGGEPQQVETGGGVPFLARDGLLWGATPTELWVVQASTASVVRRIPVPDSIEVISLGIDGSSIWVGIRHPGRVGAVLQLDYATGALVGEVRDVDIPARIEIGFGSARVTDSGGSSVFRLDAAP